MSPDDPALQAFLREQRAEYRAGLPARLARVEAALHDWERAPQPATLQALERAAHGIAGSAATFGLAQLGALARALEDACEEGTVADVPRLAQQLCRSLRAEIAAT